MQASAAPREALPGRACLGTGLTQTHWLTASEALCSHTSRMDWRASGALHLNPLGCLSILP